MIQQASQTFLSRSGAELFSSSFFKQEKNHNYHFVFLHGALDHHSFHHRFFHSILEKYPQSIVSGYDYPGHGRSGGARAHIDSFETYLDDLKFYLELISQTDSYKKLILVGYSMGGLIALDYVQRFSQYIDGMILVNPCLKLGSSSFGGFLEKAKLKNLGLLSKFKISTFSDGSELTNDDEILKEIQNDKLRCHHISYGMLQQLVSKSQQVRKTNIEKSLPILFLISGADTVVEPRVNKIYAQGLKRESVSIKWYEHSKHNLLNEVNREFVYDEINEWVSGSFK